MEKGHIIWFNAEWQVRQGLYPLDGYDVVVDTKEMLLQECAKTIYRTFE